MIDSFKNTIAKIENVPHLSYGSSQGQKNNNSENQKQENKDEQSSYITNPFGTIDGVENSIQHYFNQKYSKINAYVKNVITRLSKNGEITSKIEQAVIEINAIAARYSYDKTVLHPQNKKYIVISDKNILTIEIRDNSNKLICTASVIDDIISSISVFEDKTTMIINFKSKNLLERLLKFDNLKIANWKIYDTEGNLEEMLVYSSKGHPGVYSAYENNKEYMRLSFDLNYPEKSSSAYKIVPMEYISYDTVTKNKTQTLSYFYSRPCEYREYNLITARLTKILKLQGLGNLVYRYAFYNGKTGQLITSGGI